MPELTWMARLWWRFGALLALIGATALLAGAILTENTLRSAGREAFTARFTLTAERAAQAAENALALGVALGPDTALAGLLTREAAALAPVLRSFAIEDTGGRPLLSVTTRAGASSDAAVAGAPIRNDIGQTVGRARLHFDDAPLQEAQRQLRRAVLHATWPASLAMLAAPGLLCALLVTRLQRGRPALRLFGGERALLAGTTALFLGMALAWVGWQANLAAQAAIAPAQQAQAETLARSSAALIARALDVGVPANALSGLNRYGDELRQRSAEIASLALLAPDGTLLAGTPAPDGRPTVTAPVRLADGTLAGRVALGLDTDVLTRQLQARLLDVAFLGAVCLLLALEWVALGLGTRGARALTVTEAWRARHTAGRLPDWRPTSATAVRPALFLFMLAEELTRPFLPTWARELAPTDWGVSTDLLASGPLVVFLALVALLQWPLAAWSRRAGRRPGLVLGALLGALGLAVAASLPDYLALIGARLLGATGFALVFVSAQGAVIDGSSSRDRARSLGQFVRAILVAGLCGPLLGGMAADRWGVPATFALASGVAALAALAAWRQLRGACAGRVPARPTASASAAPGDRRAGALRGSGLLPLLLGCALPAKLLLAALCFYLLPMHLQNEGYGSATVGRLQTIYPLAMVLLVPLAARAADRRRRRSAFVVLGGVLAGVSASLAWPAGGAPLILAWILLGLGLGQALSITPQSALMADLAQREGGAGEASVLGLFRLTERGGSALGPLLGAWLLPMVGFAPALALIGGIVTVGSLAYGWSTRTTSLSAMARS